MGGENNSSMGKLSGAMKYFAFGTQMVLSIIMPFIVLIWLGAKVRERFGWGDWTVGVSIVLALLVAVCDCIHMGKVIIKQAQRDGSMAAVLAKEMGIKVKNAEKPLEGSMEEEAAPLKQEERIQIVGVRGNAAGEGAWKDNQGAKGSEDAVENKVDSDLMPPPLPNYFTHNPRKAEEGSGEDDGHGK